MQGAGTRSAETGTGLPWPGACGGCSASFWRISGRWSLPLPRRPISCLLPSPSMWRACCSCRKTGLSAVPISTILFRNPTPPSPSGRTKSGHGPVGIVLVGDLMPSFFIQMFHWHAPSIVGVLFYLPALIDIYLMLLPTVVNSWRRFTAWTSPPDRRWGPPLWPGTAPSPSNRTTGLSAPPTLWSAGRSGAGLPFSPRAPGIPLPARALTWPRHLRRDDRRTVAGILRRVPFYPPQRLPQSGHLLRPAAERRQPRRTISARLSAAGMDFPGKEYGTGGVLPAGPQICRTF